MRYWGYFAAKLFGAALVLWVLRAAMLTVMPPPGPELTDPVDRALSENQLGRTALQMLYFLISCGLLWLVVWDQKYRCRTCLRRVMMPIAKGSWTHVLLGPPRTEYICPYGHGTLKVEELQISGHQEPAWTPHQDIWEELMSLEKAGKEE